MRTDKHLYTIFSANPIWFFELCELPSPGECEMRSVVLKEIEKRADAIIFPKNPNEPITVVENQFQNDDTIYPRIVIEMAEIQLENGMRHVEGVILFRELNFDPKTKPWTRVVRVFGLREMLELLARKHPEHPLVPVFHPLMVTDEVELERTASCYYNQIETSEIDERSRSMLADVYLDFLVQRLKNRTKEEIDKMLIWDRPDTRDTQYGKDLIAIGVKEGKLEGKLEDLILLLESKFGVLNQKQQARIHAINSIEKASEIFSQALHAQSIDELNWN